MRWKRIRILVLALLLIINLGLLGLRLLRKEQTRRENEQSLRTVLALYEQRGISVKADAARLDGLASLGTLTLGAERREDLPESAFALSVQPIRELQSARLLAEATVEHWYGRSFSLLAESRAENSWSFRFCRNEGSVLCLYDCADVTVTPQGVESAVRHDYRVQSSAQPEPVCTADEILSRALWQLSRDGFEAVSLISADSVYRVQDGQAVPAARLIFQNAAGEESVLLLDAQK